MHAKALLKNIPKDQLQGKVVLVRCDFNVPLAETTSGMKVTDDSRIKATFPTLAYLVESGARVVLCSHLGRPRGHAEPVLSLKPVVESLESFGVNITFINECIGPAVLDAICGLAKGHMLLLENLRFHSGETDNDESFAQELAKGVDIFVNDAFGAAHRANASTVGVTQFIPINVAGFLMDKELTYLGIALQHPLRPLAAVVGGAKISSKLGVLRSLLDKVDKLLIGGAMVFTFHCALGHSVGDSLVEDDLVTEAREVLDLAKQRGVKLVLAVDSVVVASAELHDGSCAAQRTVVRNDAIPAGYKGVDIGSDTIRAFNKALEGCKTIIWNGPMGICEKPEYVQGTNALMHCISDLTAAGSTTIVCGGDTVAAVQREMYNMAPSDRVVSHGNGAGTAAKQVPRRLEFSHISTGGGAALEFLEGKELPGVAALDNAV